MSEASSNGARQIQSPPAEVREALAARLAGIRQNVAEAARRAGRDPEAVRLVAVTKTVPLEIIREAVALGLTTFGENRVQEAREKIGGLAISGVRWELIGHLQTNKAAHAVELFDRIESVD